MSLGRLDHDSIEIQKLQELKGSNAHAAPKVTSVLFPDIENFQKSGEYFEKMFAQEIASKV